MRALVLLAVFGCVCGAVPAQEISAPGQWSVGQAGVGYSRVSAGTMAGQILEHTQPVYPPIARAAGVSGMVVMRALIGKTGRVEMLTVLSGPQMLRGAAVGAVRTWTYKPYLLNGEPIGVDTTVAVNFNLATAGPLPQSARQAEGDSENEESGAHDAPKPVIPLNPSVIRISSGVLAGLLEEKVDPVYPTADASGAVVLKVRVNRKGEVGQVEVISGPASLKAAAIDAVSQWRYKPYLLNGEAVDVDSTVTVMFSRSR